MSILANYHTHTPRCMHATGSEESYVETAISQGYKILGFSDHTPWPFPEYESYCRMTAAQLPEYVETVRDLQKRYANNIKIHLGLEAEYAPDYMDWLHDVKKEFQLDYLIFGNHFYNSEESGIYFGSGDPEPWIEAYVEHTIKAMESGLFDYMAHPDLFLSSATAVSEKAEKALHQICKAAVKYNIPLEYNLLGESRRLDGIQKGSNLCGYTTPDFWRIAAQYPIHAIIGCDAHQPKEMCRATRQKQVRTELEQMGISVLDTIPGLD